MAALGCRQRIPEHRGELRLTVEHDGDAADDLALMLHRGRVDVGRLALRAERLATRRVERGGLVARHDMPLRVMQAQGGTRPGALQGLTHMMGLRGVGHRHHAAVHVVHQQQRVDGVERVDLLQHLLRLGRGDAGLRCALGRERALQPDVERPPAAVVGALVQVAVHDVDG